MPAPEARAVLMRDLNSLTGIKWRLEYVAEKLAAYRSRIRLILPKLRRPPRGDLLASSFTTTKLTERRPPCRRVQFVFAGRDAGAPS